MRRVACIALPQIRIEIVREREREREAGTKGARDVGPLASVIARPGGTVRCERDVLGNTRLDVVSHEARARGVRLGQTVAAARAKCSELRVRVVAEGAVRTALARVAEVAMAVGPTAAFDTATDVVWVEIGGCAHLLGGERELATVLEQRVLALGHACRVAIADGPRLAGAVARFSRGQGTQGEGRVVPVGRGAEALRALPMEALDLEDGTLAWLKDLGLRTCGDLQKQPRRSLGLRLGTRTKDVMQLLAGEDGAPLDAWRPPEVPEERAELEWGAGSVEALVFVARSLCDRLAARLEGRALAATRLAIILGLDRALLPHDARAGAVMAVHEIAVPVPVVRASDLFAVVRSRLERVELPAPALAVTLRALELSVATARPLDLLTPEPKAARALPSLVAELATELGMDRVGVLALSDVWAPEDRTRLVPFGVRDLEKRSPAPLVTSAVEPSRLLRSATRTRAPGNATPNATHISRLEAVGWWRRGRSERRDFYEIWDGAGLAWAEVRGHEAWLRGWID